ncbi:MAG: ribosomal protein [Bacteroidota bacterium]
MQRRLPKRGFKNPNRTEYVSINLDRLQEYVDKYQLKDVSPQSLYENHIIGKNDKVKILGRGELSAAVNVTIHAVSAAAKESIVQKGGSVNLI